MKTGITFTDNQDLSYIGLRQVGTSADYTETVINWSDNDWGSVDDMAFRFTGAPTSSNTNLPNHKRIESSSKYSLRKSISNFKT